MSNYRKITDVEVVEQMTENDTILIEQNGEIKRTKGVVGGGLNVVVNFDYSSESDNNTITLDITYDKLKAAILSREPINARCVYITDGVVVGCGVIAELYCDVYYDSESDTETECILIATMFNEFAFLPDGTAKYPNLSAR